MTKLHKKSAVTLTELLVAIMVAALVMVPAFHLYQKGMKSSVSGVISLEMLAEGRRIMNQIQNDLKNSAIPYHGAFSVTFSDLLTVTVSGNPASPGAEYSLYRFARENSLARTVFSPAASLLRPLISVRYQLEKKPDSGLYRLTRIETAKNAPDRIKLMSERVQVLQIKPFCVKYSSDGQKWMWNSFLRLAHTNNGQSEAPKTADQQQGYFSMEFYDIVCSDFFNAIDNDPWAIRNWNTGLSHSPD
jgi:hypothetical protein